MGPNCPNKTKMDHYSPDNELINRYIKELM